MDEQEAAVFGKLKKLRDGSRRGSLCDGTVVAEVGKLFK